MSRELDLLEHRVRLCTQGAAFFAGLAFFSGSFMVSEVSPEEALFNQRVLPWMAFYMFLMSTVGFSKRLNSAWYYSLSIIVPGLYLVFRVYATLFILPVTEDYQLHLGPISPWLPMVLIASFALLDLRVALIFGIFFSFSLALVVFFFLKTNGLFIHSTSPVEAWIQHYVLALPAITIMLWVLSLYKRSFYTTTAREEQLRTISLTDPLTGLGNRRSLDELMARDLARARRSEGKFSVVLLDIDHFKSINDRFGHHVGDQVLKAIGTILREQTRSSEWSGRWGGEEFMIGVQGDLRQAKIVAERFRKLIEDYREENLPAVTASFGLTEYRNHESAASLLMDVDAALYESKRKGRNRVESFAPSMALQKE